MRAFAMVAASATTASRSTSSAQRLGLLPRVVAQALDRLQPAREHLAHLLGALDDVAHPPALGAALDDLEVQPERAQDVLEIVRDAGRHLAERAELLAAHERLLRGLERGVGAAEVRDLLGLRERGGGEVDERVGDLEPRRLGLGLVLEEEHERAEQVRVRDHEPHVRAAVRAARRGERPVPELGSEDLGRRRPRAAVDVLRRRDRNLSVGAHLCDDRRVPVHDVDARAGEHRQVVC